MAVKERETRKKNVRKIKKKRTMMMKGADLIFKI